MDIDIQGFAVANLRRRPAVVEIGGFVAGFDPGTTSPYLNYATPLPGAEPTGRDVAALVAAFRERGLRPRLEFAPDAAPAVEPALRAAGFTTDEVHEYLVCVPAALTGPGGRAEAEPASYAGRATAGVFGPHLVEVPSSDEDYAAIDAALSEAFTGAFSASPEGAARLRRTQESGGAVRFVRAPGGGCAGGGSCSPPTVGTAEVSGIGTRPVFRGRGIAAAVTAALTEAMFARGAASVWLEYSGDGPRRVYEHVGYRPRGTRLYMSLAG